MNPRKLIVPVLTAVAVLALALLWLRYAPWPAMMADAPVAAPPPAPADADVQADARADARAAALAERRRQTEQAAAELERRLTSAEERAARLRKTRTWTDLNDRLSAARRLLEIAHAPDEALELLQRTVREIETASGMETAREALNDDIARLTEYAAQSPRRAVPLIGELLALLEPVPVNDENTRLDTNGNTGADADTDAGSGWSRFLARLPEQLKAAVRVERRGTPSADDTRLLRHLLMRARLAALENDAQAFDALTGDAARLAADRGGDDTALRDGLARLRALEMQWRPPSLGAALGPPPTEAQ